MLIFKNVIYGMMSYIFIIFQLLSIYLMIRERKRQKIEREKTIKEAEFKDDIDKYNL